jgi:hypothetical protein
MATPILDSLHTQLAILVGDEVASASTAGKVYSVADRLNAINQARGKLFNTILTQIGIEKFSELYKEYAKESSALTLTTSAVAKPTNCRYIIACILTRTSTNAGDYDVKKIPEITFYEFVTDLYSNFQSSASEYKYRLSNSVITIYGERSTGISFATVAGTIKVSYIEDPLDLSTDLDYYDPPQWKRDVLEIAKTILLSMQQIGE